VPDDRPAPSTHRQRWARKRPELFLSLPALRANQWYPVLDRHPEEKGPEAISQPGYVWIDVAGKPRHVWAAQLEFREEGNDPERRAASRRWSDQQERAGETAECGREYAEMLRQDAEELREIMVMLRVRGQGYREMYEATRQAADLVREHAEAIRLEHERARNLAEEIRQLHEAARQEAEQIGR
jgi:hypothetical protein